MRSRQQYGTFLDQQNALTACCTKYNLLDSTFDLGEDLRDRFIKGNHSRFSDLLHDLHSIKQVKAVRNYTHMKYVSCFLKGLNDTYHNIHTQILLLDIIPNTNRVYSLIAQQEFTYSSPSDVLLTILYANNPNNTSRGKGRDNSKGSMLCIGFHKTNHTVETCYFKHGFLLGYRTINSKTSSGSKPTITLEEEGIISKEDYQHL
ncbi:hypothetical protein KIW84_025401 [Lathyrus oleraceus]|uniref:Uncharacterized protein n=1 Tax=Pisum sativum TaxID=3888 RepID=A0A9D4YI47_PEA|nr:hypothetical protein KIW84_025401 [Pisum sativum]